MISCGKLSRLSSTAGMQFLAITLLKNTLNVGIASALRVKILGLNRALCGAAECLASSCQN